MKILLVGEFSGVHNNLKMGLKALGHDVKLAADGDGFKKFGYDFRIKPFRFLLFPLNIFYFIVNIKKFVGFDIVQFINPCVLPTYYFYFGIPQLIFKFNKKIVYYVCGTDPAFINSKEKFKYFPFDNTNSSEFPKYHFLFYYYYLWFVEKIDIIIPSMYTYAVGYYTNKKLKGIIPLPGSSKYVLAPSSISKEKIRVLFGISRYDFKGARYILEALEKITEIYGNKVKINIVESLPFLEYNHILESNDILIDQCKTYDYGMNGIFGMEKGLIVLSGNEEESSKYFDLIEIKNPIINIIPDSEQIFNVLERLINLTNEELYKHKIESLTWVKNVHDNYLVSQKFLQQYLLLLE